MRIFRVALFLFISLTGPATSAKLYLEHYTSMLLSISFSFFYGRSLAGPPFFIASSRCSVPPQAHTGPAPAQKNWISVRARRRQSSSRLIQLDRDPDRCVVAGARASNCPYQPQHRGIASGRLAGGGSGFTADLCIGPLEKTGLVAGGDRALPPRRAWGACELECGWPGVRG